MNKNVKLMVECDQKSSIDIKDENSHNTIVNNCNFLVSASQVYICALEKNCVNFKKIYGENQYITDKIAMVDMHDLFVKSQRSVTKMHTKQI